MAGIVIFPLYRMLNSGFSGLTGVKDGSERFLWMRSLVTVTLLCWSLFLLAMGLVSAQLRDQSRQLPAANDERKNIDVGGTTRSYLIHVPSSYKKDKPLPLVLIFHGGGSDPQGMVRYTRFDDLADVHGFITVYPEGTLKQWNDGRLMAPKSDDVGFVRSIIEEVGRNYKLDKHRIYATGISNGGMMSQRLACELSGTLAAIALYYYSPVVLSLLRTYLDAGNNADQPGRFVQWLYTRKPVNTFEIKGRWLDIGSKETLESADRILAPPR